MTKLRLKNKGLIPYGGNYTLNRPDLGLIGKGLNWEMLIPNLIAYRRANSIPIGLGFENEVEQALCQKYFHECEGFDPMMPKPRQLDMETVLRGTKMLSALVLEWGKYLLGLSQHPLVDQIEAERRAKICANCPLNVSFTRPCSGICPELAVVIKAVKGNRTTPYDADLRSCSVCGCMTQAHVWPRLDILDKGLTDEQRGQFKNVNGCWKILN